MDIGALLTTAPDRTAVELGTVLRTERDRAGITQAELARQAGVSQATVSAVERGTRRPSLTVIDLLLAVLGRQLDVDVGPIDLPDADLDAAIAAQLDTPPGERLRSGRFDGVALLRLLAPAAPIAEGAAAAVLHGAPIPCPVLEIAVARDHLDPLAAVIRSSRAERWSEVWEQWGVEPADPRIPGPCRWWLLPGEFRVRIVDERPETVTILVDDLPVAVPPLHTVAAADRRVRRALARLPPPGTRPSPGTRAGARAECGCGQPAKNDALSARSSSGCG